MFRRGPLAVAGMLTLGVALARLTAVAELADPAGGALPASLHLGVPLSHALAAPLFTLWDAMAMLTVPRLKGLLAGLALGYLLWRVVVRVRHRLPAGRALLREAGLAVAAFALFAAFAAAGVLWHRPMRGLAGMPPTTAAVDYHSHTNASRDVRGTLMDGYDLEANRAWHRRAGYDAVFITDHNRRTLGEASPGTTGPVLCPAIEIGAWRAHVVVLGPDAPEDRSEHRTSYEGLLGLLAETRALGAPAVLSIPEYERNHADRLDTLFAAGAAALELVNGSPKADLATRTRRDSVLAVARAHDAAVVGVSDHHGWGATAMTWSLVERAASDRGAALCTRAAAAVDEGIDGVQIVERHHLRTDAAWPLLLTPLGMLWEVWRSVPGVLVASWLAWIWAAAVVSARRPAPRGSRKR